MAEAVIYETKYEGKQIGKYLVLNYINKTDEYYVRLNIDNEYKIAKMRIEDILNNTNNFKIIKKLTKNPYVHTAGNTTILYDINGKEIYIDTDDFDKVRGITWRAHEPSRNRSSHDTWYVYGGKWDKETKKWTQYSIHRFILDMIESEYQVDHKDLDGLNNRKSNLRCATNTENARHKSTYRNSESGFTGVRLDKRTNVYQARITVNGHQIFLGESKDIEEAKRLRLEAEEKYFGEFKTVHN